MRNGKKDVEKEKYWRRAIGEAARSGISIREFCRRRGLKESQFYWWQHRLKAGGQESWMRKPGVNGTASFALVGEEAGTTDAGIELMLPGGRRLRISKGVDEATLRAVLVAVESAGC